MNVFEQSRETHPAEADANYEMYLSGVAYEKLGDYEKAASLFAQILETMEEERIISGASGDGIYVYLLDASNESSQDLFNSNGTSPSP